MKIKLLSILVLCSFLISKETKPLMDVIFEELQNSEITKKWKQSFYANSYKTESFGLIKVGSKLIIGKAVPGNFKAKENVGFFSSSSPSQVAIYSTLIQGGVFGSEPLEAGFEGEEVTIDKIWIYRTSIKRTAKFYVGVIVKNNSGENKMFSMRKSSNLVKSLSSGEIINPDAPMTKNQAIAKLKEGKELLELEIISQDEYDALKKELTPMIIK